MKKDLISIKDLSATDIQDIFMLTEKLKKDKSRFGFALRGKTLALIFQKPSNRTRVSFEVGMYQLGGNSIYLGPEEINLGVREPIKDVARTLSRYIDGIVFRTFEHKNILELAKYSDKPVINGLSDFSHPCQALADIYTIREKLKKIKGLTLAFIGDGNNVCNSLMFACSKIGMNMKIATPKSYEPDTEVLKEARQISGPGGNTIELFNNPQAAAKDADVLYTDVWTSMGMEDEKLKRNKLFKRFQIDSALVGLAKKDAIIMHCLPAHRGEEISDEVIESRNSVVFDQAENRMHVQKAVLIRLLKK